MVAPGGQGSLTWCPASRRGGAGWASAPSDLLPSSIHTPAKASAAMTLQWSVVPLVIALGYVEPQVGRNPLKPRCWLWVAALLFAQCQSLDGFCQQACNNEQADRATPPPVKTMENQMPVDGLPSHSPSKFILHSPLASWHLREGGREQDSLISRLGN